MSRYLETFEDVTVQYDHSTGKIHIEDWGSGEQLAVFKVVQDD